jgi:hypothetical protein
MTDNYFRCNIINADSPVDAQHRRFSPEDGDSMYLRHVYLPASVHGVTTQKNIIKELVDYRCPSYYAINSFREIVA